jgi:hypothetical protein
MNHSESEGRVRTHRATEAAIPGLTLTAAQASRFWSLSTAQGEALLATLCDQGVLSRTADGRYVLFARPRAE